MNGTANIYKYKRDLYTDNNFTKIPIVGYAPKSNIMSIYSCISTQNVIEKCIINMWNIPPLFNVNNL